MLFHRPIACGSIGLPGKEGEVIMGFALSDMTLTSSAFEDGGPIPTQHTGEGKDVSPALSWSKVPEDTRSFALICHDPDAPLVSPGTYGFVHWVLYGIPGSVTGLAEGSDDYVKGVNNFGNPGYGGPMPPGGHGTHHYFFWLLALDSEPDLEGGLSMWELLEKVEPNVIGANRLVGTYSRS
jgi:Raf kinase inhibitor-like YbhB/YbcL family protein